MPILPPVPALAEAQNGATVPTVTGAEVEVRLSSNPSTGYSWQVVRGPPAVVVVRRSYTPAAPAPGPPRLGLPGRQVFDLRVLALAGRTVPVVLAYKPPGRALAFGRIWKVRLRVVAPARPASQPSPPR